MNDNKKIQMLTDTLRNASNTFDAIALSDVQPGHVAYLTKARAAELAKVATAEAEAVLAMVEDDGDQAETLASLPELTPALRAAGAIMAKYGLGEGLSISQACGRVHEIADIFAKLNTREASNDAR